jgi:hypothetical protein
MNDYVTLDGNKYKAPFGQWDPEVEKPSSVRLTLGGSIDVTYGPGIVDVWDGFLKTTNDPTEQSNGFGSPDDLDTTYRKTQTVSFTDHHGDSYTVHIVGRKKQKSNTPDWEGEGTSIYYSVTLVKV